MVTLRLKVKIDPDKRNEFIQSLDDMGFTTTKSLASGTVYQSLKDENLFCCYGDWDSRVDLAWYLASDEYSVFSGALKVLGRIEESCVLESVPDDESIVN